MFYQVKLKCLMCECEHIIWNSFLSLWPLGFPDTHHFSYNTLYFPCLYHYNNMFACNFLSGLYYCTTRPLSLSLYSDNTLVVSVECIGTNFGLGRRGRSRCVRRWFETDLGYAAIQTVHQLETSSNGLYAF